MAGLTFDTVITMVPMLYATLQRISSPKAGWGGELAPMRILDFEQVHCHCRHASFKVGVAVASLGSPQTIRPVIESFLVKRPIMKISNALARLLATAILASAAYTSRRCS